MAVKTIAEVSLTLDAINVRMKQRDELDSERRKVDDLRHERAAATAIAQATRTTALETNWTAFFGPQGAFTGLMEELKLLRVKTDRQNWYIAMGVGIILAAQTWLRFAKI